MHHEKWVVHNLGQVSIKAEVTPSSFHTDIDIIIIQKQETSALKTVVFKELLIDDLKTKARVQLLSSCVQERGSRYPYLKGSSKEAAPGVAIFSQ